MSYKLGSLFDGSGGFPLAGSLCGIEPVWAAEIEPYPIAVTRSRFPNMKHLGDISKINGAEIEPVDIVCAGSPCQDLSVAGLRKGLKHESNGDEETTRSGLFMEFIRIVKEMRRATDGKYPKYALWENVPGAFSSNKGEDFKVVLEEIIKIVEPSALMPEVPQKGWNYSDSYCGDGWSLAYRVLDAQYWGVPQRRRRIYLVADLRGGSAREVLFEREGLRGYFTQGRTPWKDTPANAQGSTGADDHKGDGIHCLTPWDSQTRRCYGTDGAAPSLCAGAETSGQNQQSFLVPVERIGRQLDDVVTVDKESHSSEVGAPGVTVGGPCATLLAQGVPHAVCYGVENHPADSRVNIDESGKVQTLTSRMGTGGGNVPMVMEEKSDFILPSDHIICLQGNGIDRADNAGCNGKGWKEGASYTLNTVDRPAVAYGVTTKGNGDVFLSKERHTTLSVGGGQAGQGYPCTVYTVDQGGIKPGAVCCTTGSFMTTTEEVTPTLMARDYKDPTCVAYWDGGQTVGTLTANNAGGNQRMPDKENFNCVIDSKKYIVRRLTPTECARLQGFADWHGHIEKKKKLTDEEYSFWTEVRDTHAAINGKAVKDYNKRQMLTWYNKLWTDSSEYKMWGNGIALPTALYVLQGISDALSWSEFIE